MCVYYLITAGHSTKLFVWGGGDIGGHVRIHCGVEVTELSTNKQHTLRETTSRGLCGLVCPSRTSERGGEGDCVKEGGGGERVTPSHGHGHGLGRHCGSSAAARRRDLASTSQQLQWAPITGVLCLKNAAQTAITQHFAPSAGARRGEQSNLRPARGLL